MSAEKPLSDEELDGHIRRRLLDNATLLSRFDRLKARNRKLVEVMRAALAVSRSDGDRILRAAIEENDDGK